MPLRIPTILLILSGLVILPIALLAIGAFFPDIPYFGTIVLPHFTGRASQFFLLALLGSLLALAAHRLCPRRISMALTALGLLTAASALVIIASHLRVAWDSEATIDLLATLSSRNYWEGASPDTTVVYGTSDGDSLLLDIYQPRGSKETEAPVVLYVHGGGWAGNDPRTQAANLRWFADHGYVAVSPEYQLATPERPTWNRAWPQVSCAMAWIAANGKRFGADTSRIYAYGESSGGALALTASYATAMGLAPSFCDGRSPRIRAVAANVPAVDPHSFYHNPDRLLGPPSREMVTKYIGGSPEDHLERVRYVSPSTYIAPQSPPTLIFLSNDDRLVPIGGTQRFIGEVRRAGVTINTIRFPFADHSLSIKYNGIANQAMLQIMDAFFSESR